MGAYEPVEASFEPIASFARCLPARPSSRFAEILRLVLEWEWTYVIMAELIGSPSGVGQMITDSRALLATGQIIFSIILIGLVADSVLKAFNRRLFPRTALR
jgi:ABC-type nitrate/sulfonate/bicarbonate transport system permease component